MSILRTAWLAVLASLIPALASGCSPTPAIPEETCVRLVDEMEHASLRSDADLADMPAVLRRLGGPTQLVANQDSVTARGAWLAPLLFEDGTAADPTLVIYGAKARTGLPVTVSLPAAPGVERAFVVDSDVDPGTLQDQKALEPLLESARGDATELTRQADGSWFGAVASVRSGHVLACLAARSPQASSGPAEFGFPGPEAQWLLTAPSLDGSPWARRASASYRSWEAVVLVAPGEVSWPVHVPSVRPRFTSTVRAQFLDRATCSLTLRVGQDVLWSGELKAEKTQLDIELAAYAGQDVTLSMVLGLEGEAPLPLAVIGAPVVEGDAPNRPMDVILVSLDTVRADRMSLYGGPRKTTPAIDALAGSSMVFDNATAAAPWTLPSHVSIFSGQLPDRHGVFRENSHIPAGLPWLTSDFRDAGYETVAFTASGYLEPSFGFAKDFESYGTTELVYPEEFAARKPTLLGQETAGKAAAATAERRQLMELLHADRRRPMFLFVHTYEAHEYRGKPDVLRRFGARESDLDTLLDGVYGVPPSQNPYFKAPFTPEEQQRLRERAELMYDASLFSADELVGEIVAALTETGRLDRTLLVITSDHGEELLNRTAIGHGKSLYSEQIHVPLVIRGPGVRQGRAPDLVSLVDIAPTLRTLCGLVDPSREAAPDQDGHSLAPILSGSPLRPRFLMAYGGQRRGKELAFRALRGDRLKLIETETTSGEALHQLFDVSVDPGETRDLAASHPADVEQASQLLQHWVATLQADGRGAETSSLDAETEQTLKGLGYLGGR